MNTERTQEAEASQGAVENAGRRRFARQALLGLAAAGAAFVAAPQQAQAGSSSDNWKMEGNGNVDSNDFLGTTNAQPLVLKTNGQQRMTVHPNGDVSVGDPNAYARLSAKADLTNGVAVRGDSASTQPYAAGVLGTLTAVNTAGSEYPAAVRGIVTSTTNTAGVAVVGWHKGNGTGVIGRNAATSNRPAVVGLNTATTGDGIAVYGSTMSSASTARGVHGNAPNGAGVYGTSDTGNGVYGQGQNGVYARTDSVNGTAVYALVNNSGSTGRALYAYMPPGAPGFAGEFYGKVKITGNLHLSGSIVKSFAAITTLDHPLDPENRTLSMAGVESPEPKHIYDGVVTLDAQGRATVDLPAYLEALNGDFRYQLTPIGGPMPHLHVSAEIKNGRFAIAGGKPGKRVSWQVTGVRADAAAKASPFVAEAAKPAAERGTYLNPAAHGQPAERGADFARAAAGYADATKAAAIAPAVELDLPAEPALEMPAAPVQ